MAELISHHSATGEELGRAPICSADDVRAAVQAARCAQVAWAALTVRQRLDALKPWQRLLLTQADALAQLIVAEQGKNQIEAYGEVLSSLDLLSFYMRRAERALRPRRVWPRLGALRAHRLVAQPYGVVGVISPWNYPLMLSMDSLIAALVAGNAVVLKPSEYTPLIGLKIGELARQAGLPEGLVQVVTGDATTGQALIAGGIDKLVFTGSAANGRRVAALAGQHLVPVTLELGGKDAAIVLADADLDRAAEGVLWGALLNAGQACLAIERIYVEQPVAEAFTQKLVEKAQRLRVGPASDPCNDVGAITTEAQLNVVQQQLQEAVQRGARVLTGGRPLPGPGRFFPPTVLTDVADDMALMRDETFGPLLPIRPVRDAEEAVRLTNASPYGLTASIWTRDIRRGQQLLTRLAVSDASINEHGASSTYAEVGWGGRKASGFGRTRGIEGLYEMVIWQHLSWPRLDLPLMRFPYSAAKVDFVRALLYLLFGTWRERASALKRILHFLLRGGQGDA